MEQGKVKHRNRPALQSMAQSDALHWQLAPRLEYITKFFQTYRRYVCRVRRVCTVPNLIRRRMCVCVCDVWLTHVVYCFANCFLACNDTSCSTDKWFDRLENSNWLTLVLNSLNAACVVAQCLDQEGSPCLVHGGKGMDSTLIVTSLVQIILNPDCRTVRGYVMLTSIPGKMSHL